MKSILSFFRRKPKQQEEPKTDEQNILEQKWKDNINLFAQSTEAYAKQIGLPSTPKFAPIKKAYNGDVYFTYANIEEIPASRFKEIQQAYIATNFACTIEKYDKEVLPKLDSIVKNSDKDEALNFCAWALAQQEICNPISLLVNLGTALLIRHDENPFTICKITQNKKIAAAKEDADLLTFFMGVGATQLQECCPEFYKTSAFGKRIATLNISDIELNLAMIQYMLKNEN